MLRKKRASPGGLSQEAPSFLFAAVSLEENAGGIAMLSRQVLRVLLDMHQNNLIRLEVHVLEGSRQSGMAAWPEESVGCKFCWYEGNRWQFSLNLLRARVDMQLLDHVGLARLTSLLPFQSCRNYALLVHGVELWNKTRSDYLRSARRAALLIANSHYTAARVVSRSPGLSKICVCWPGKGQAELGPQAGKTVSQIEGIGPHAMLIVGRMDASQRHKGHDQLIDALPLILQTVPDAQLVIAGAGNDRDRLEKRVKDMGVADSTVFMGWVNEEKLHRLYLSSAVFVMPSVGDGFGLVFLEAMMRRVPCVGLKGSAAEEILDQGKSGVLVDHQHKRELAAELSGLLLDENRRKQIGEAGYKRYESHFQARHFAGRLQSVLMTHLAAGNGVEMQSSRKAGTLETGV